MTDCKHDWHFIEGTERLRCERCKVETGPKSYEQRVQDMLKDVTTMGSAWSRGGERIDPTSVYKPYVPPKPVGAWVIDPSGDAGHGPCTMFHVFNKPTDEQIKNTEATFGWKWRDV
jgi:hypothetical protein